MMYRMMPVMMGILAVACGFAACVKRADREPEPPSAMQAPDREEPPSDEWEQAAPVPPESAAARLPGKKDLVIPAGTKIPVDVVHVVDGDTVTVQTLQKPARMFKVRMAGINAPECHKERRGTSKGVSAACTSDDEGSGLAAYHSLRKLLAGKSIEMTCKTLPNSSICEQDRYGRLLATLWAAGEDVNRKMVEEGMAMAFTKYPHDGRASYCQAEFAARAARRGMWSLASTVEGVLSLMSQKTRHWYSQHDELCRAAIRTQAGTKGN